VSSSLSNPAVCSAISSWYQYGDVVFNDPLPTVNDSVNYLTEGMTEMDLLDKFKYRPEWFAAEYLGSSDLWWAVLMANHMASYQEFDRARVNLPSTSVIQSYISMLNSRKANVLDNVQVIEDLTLYPVRI
jgi:hypothetical protein